MGRALINVPARAKRGEVIAIKALVSHPMETGYRTGPDGALVPRDIIQRFVCTYNGEEVFSADFFPAIAANPFIAFTTVATESGTIIFRWIDDQRRGQIETAKTTVKCGVRPSALGLAPPPWSSARRRGWPQKSRPRNDAPASTT